MIEATNIIKTYNNRAVLNGISLKIFDGDFFVISGRSGSGKSTLLYILSTMEKCDSGDIFYDGNSIDDNYNKKVRFRSDNIGFIFQSFNLEEMFTVLENVEIPLIINNVSKKHRRKICIEKLKQVGMEDRINEKVAILSGGEKQRVAIARALICNPKYIFADEPCGNLDKANSTNVLMLLKKLSKNGTTIILVTHNADDMKYGNRFIILEDGRRIDKEEEYQ